MSEFDLIKRYFTKKPSSKIELGVGDDCALFALPEGERLAVSTDLLIAGTHFFDDTDPMDLGHKSLAVNLSDLAAMGARPIGCTLAVALPYVDEAWIAAFAQGFFDLASVHQCDLIGGDTTKGPLSVCVTVFGTVPSDQALRRDKAQIGDDIWISNAVGEARAGLEWLRHNVQLLHPEEAVSRLQRPTPRVELGLALRGLAHAAIDVSDGLLGDLGHILECSQVGATLRLEDIPVSPLLMELPQEQQQQFILSGGDDYELCFTVPKEHREAIETIGQSLSLSLSCIGTIENEGLQLLRNGQSISFSGHSFDHFL